MVQRRWLMLAVLTAGLVGSAIVARRRPFSARLAWFLTLPGVRAIGRVEELAALLDVRPGMRVLDAGAGPGRLTLPLAERVGPEGTVTALDMQPRMLELVEQRAAARGLTNIDFLLAELGHGTLAAQKPAFYDRALLVHVLGETEDAGAALRELAVALRPGGRLATVEHWGDPHFVREQRIRELAVAAGLELATVRRSLWGHTTIWEKPVESMTKGAA